MQGWQLTVHGLFVPRARHTATLLHNGRVFIHGGLIGDIPGTGGVTGSSELYDPEINDGWAFVAELHEARMYHTATLLLDGRVLVVGGYRNGRTLDSSELYDPATGTWTLGETLFYARRSHTATRLQDGRVLIAAGFNDTQDSLQSCVVFYPDSGDFVDQGNLNTPRRNHTATLLYTGHVMVVGGSHGGGDQRPAQALASTEFYDPSTGGWTLGPEMNHRRYAHTQTLLRRNLREPLEMKILVAGGTSNPDESEPGDEKEILDTAELFTSGEVSRGNG